MEIMGRSAQDLNPLILQGSDALRELAEEAKETGYVLDESQIKKLGEVDDAYQRMQLTLEATRNKMAAEFAPASKAAMETFSNVVQKAGQTLVDTHLIENIGGIVQGVMGIIDAGTAFASVIPDWMNPISQLSTQLRGLALIAGTVADFLTIVAGLAPWNWGSGMVKQGLGMGATESNVQQLLNHNRDTTGGTRMNAYNAAGTDNWRGGLTWVGEAGPELVSLPRGSQIYSNQESRSMAGVNIGTVVIEARTIRELNDLVRIFQGAQIEGRMS